MVTAMQGNNDYSAPSPHNPTCAHCGARYAGHASNPMGDSGPSFQCGTSAWSRSWACEEIERVRIERDEMRGAICVGTHSVENCPHARFMPSWDRMVELLHECREEIAEWWVSWPDSTNTETPALLARIVAEIGERE